MEVWVSGLNHISAKDTSLFSSEGSNPSTSAMVTILRKEGFMLNPNDKVVNSLLKMIERNEGNCPCNGNTSEDKHCPCSNYVNNNNCICGLYKPIGKA